MTQRLTQCPQFLGTLSSPRSLLTFTAHVQQEQGEADLFSHCAVSSKTPPLPLWPRPLCSNSLTHDALTKLTSSSVAHLLSHSHSLGGMRVDGLTKPDLRDFTHFLEWNNTSILCLKCTLLPYNKHILSLAR